MSLQEDKMGKGTNVVQVAEGIYVQDVHEAWGEAEVGYEACEHVPWVILSAS